MDLDYATIGMRIRRFRKERGLTQQSLAELSDQEPSNISHIERGATKLSLHTLVNIANALGVTTDDILCDSLTSASAIYERDMGILLADCNHSEMMIITETLRSLKENLRKASANR